MRTAPPQLNSLIQRGRGKRPDEAPATVLVIGANSVPPGKDEGSS